MFSLKALQQAADNLYQWMPPTPQYAWPQLATLLGTETWVKHENHTPTTAFKVRGGLTLISHLLKLETPPKGLISATRGNHGQSLAYAGKRLGLPVVIVVPECNSEDQNRAIQSHGAELVIHGEDFEAARLHSLELQKQTGYRPVAPFETELVLGVATYAYELFNAVEGLDRVYVPIGMGSGICGLIKTRDLLGLDTQIVGVVAKGAPCFSLSLQEGRVVPTPEANTFADGIATRSPMQEAFDIIQEGVSHIVEVEEEEIAFAMHQLFRTTHNLAEGAGAASLAGALKEKQQLKGLKIGLILSGGNIDFDRYVEKVSAYY